MVVYLRRVRMIPVGCHKRERRGTYGSMRLGGGVVAVAFVLVVVVVVVVLVERVEWSVPGQFGQGGLLYTYFN
jgi:uncharacterized membrane protein